MIETPLSGIEQPLVELGEEINREVTQTFWVSKEYLLQLNELSKRKVREPRTILNAFENVQLTRPQLNKLIQNLDKEIFPKVSTELLIPQDLIELLNEFSKLEGIQELIKSINVETLQFNERVARQVYRNFFSMLGQRSAQERESLLNQIIKESDLQTIKLMRELFETFDVINKLCNKINESLPKQKLTPQDFEVLGKQSTELVILLLRLYSISKLIMEKDYARALELTDFLSFERMRARTVFSLT